jgi:hypothetical protein
MTVEPEAVQKAREQYLKTLRRFFNFGAVVSTLVFLYVGLSYWTGTKSTDASNYFQMKRDPSGAVGKCAAKQSIDATKFFAYNSSTTTMVGFDTCGFVRNASCTSSVAALQTYVRTCNIQRNRFTQTGDDSYITVQDYNYNFYRDQLPSILAVGIVELVSLLIRFFLLVKSKADPLYSNIVLMMLQIALTIALMIASTLSIFNIIYFSIVDFCMPQLSDPANPCSFTAWKSSGNGILHSRDISRVSIGIFAGCVFFLRFAVALCQIWVKRRLMVLKVVANKPLNMADKIMRIALCVRMPSPSVSIDVLQQTKVAPVAFSQA